MQTLAGTLETLESTMDALAGDLESDCTQADAETTLSYISSLRAQLDRIEAAAKLTIAE